MSDTHAEGHAGSPSSSSPRAPRAHAPPSGGGASASNPEELWVTRGGGQSRVWFELRCASCTSGLDLGEDMWRDAAQLLGSDVGLFYAEQQQFVEAALSVVASSNGLTTLKGVLEGVLGRLDHTRGAFVCLALSNILSWVGSFEDAAAFLEDAMNFVPTAAVNENQWLGVLHCNRRAPLHCTPCPAAPRPTSRACQGEASRRVSVHVCVFERERVARL